MAEVRLDIGNIRLLVIGGDPLAHLRKQIRDQVVSLVSSAPSLGASKVFGSRVHNITDPPAAKVFTATEDEEEITEDTYGEHVRTLPVFVELYVKAVETFDDQVDALCTEVEPTIMADRTLGGLVKAIRLRSTSIEFDDEQEQPVAKCTLLYHATYTVDPTDPETPI